MLMYGSTMFFVQVLRDLARHPQLWNTAGIFPDSYCLAAGMATSGSLTDWVRQLVGGVPFETLVEEATQVRPAATGCCCCRTSPASEPPSSTRTPAA